MRTADIFGGSPSTAGLRTQPLQINDLSVYINADNMYTGFNTKERRIWLEPKVKAGTNTMCWMKPRFVARRSCSARKRKHCRSRPQTRTEIPVFRYARRRAGRDHRVPLARDAQIILHFPQVPTGYSDPIGQIFPSFMDRRQTIQSAKSLHQRRGKGLLQRYFDQRASLQGRAEYAPGKRGFTLAVDLSIGDRWLPLTQG